MARFHYKALDTGGEVVTGFMEGENEREVLERIQGENLIPVEVKVQTLRKKGLDFSFLQVGSTRKEASEKEIFWFTQQFSRLLNSGFNVDQAIGLIQKQNNGPGLNHLLNHMRLQFQEGRTFAEALADFPKLFSPFYIHMVEAGELGGILAETIKQIENFKSKQDKLRKKLISSLAYPVIMILTLVFTAIIFLFFIIPEFAGMYAEMNRELPLITHMVLFVSQTFINYGWLILVFLFGAVLASHFYVKKTGSRLRDRVLIKSADFVDLYIEFISERFCRVMGSLLASGVQAYPALEVAKKTIDNHFIQEHLSNVQVGIQKGQSMSQTLWQDQVFSEIMIQGVDLGEQNGRLGEVLAQLADQFEESINSKIELFLGIIEPVMTLVVAVFVVIMILAMVMPMMGASTII